MRKLTYKEIKLFIESPEGNGCKLLTTKEDIKEILEKFEEYKINYCNSYQIGYKDHKGMVNYYDLEKK